MTAAVHTLHHLSKSTLALADPTQDLRRRRVIDAEGADLGIVEDLLVDDLERRVRFLRVRHGGLLGIGADHFMVPVEAVDVVGEDAVRLTRTGSEIAGAPHYDPELVEQPDWTRIYGYWGYAPYWMAPTYPPYPFP